MELAIMLMFMGAVLLFGLRPGFKTRTGAENAYYAGAAALCLVVLTLKILGLWHLDPLGSLTALFHRQGLIR